MSTPRMRLSRRRGEPEVEDAVVIGAGAAGLAAAGALAAEGVWALVLDRADSIGSSWRTRYERLRLNTTRRLSSLPGRNIDPSCGRWVSREDYIGYLEQYAREHVPRVSLGVSVEGLEPRAGGWNVHTDRGELAARSVIVATGFDRVPKLPAWPGRDAFRGALLHSAEYRNPAPFRDIDVLVVGAGTSGNEIAVDLLEGGARSVEVAIRARPTIYPREWHGIPISAGASSGPPLPAPVMDRLGALLERAIWGDLTRLGLEPPALGISTSTELKGHGIAVDSGLIDAIASGKIEPVAAVEDLYEEGARLTDGQRMRADAIIAATGFSCGLEPLLGRFPGVLRPDGRPAISGAEEVAGAPSLHTIGFRLPISGQLPELRRDARAIARKVARRSPARAAQANRFPSSAAWSDMSFAN